MAKSKSFGSYRPVGTEPIDMNIYDQTFKVRGDMSGIQLLHMIKALDGDSELDSAETMISFIERAVLTADRERCMEYLENSEPAVPLTMLTEIISWLIEEYTAKPTEPSPLSVNGSTVSGTTSMENVSLPELISPPSTLDNSLPSPLLDTPVT
jgi:hypothetical protein